MHIKMIEAAMPETIEYEKGHKNSRGEDAPWVIRDHKGGKALASFPSEDAAKAHLERMRHYAKTEADASAADIKDIANHVKALNPQKATTYNAFGDPKGTTTFPKWYGDTKKLLFPCQFYNDKDMNQILKQGEEYITKTYGKGKYTLPMEKVYSSAFHANCYAVRIKPAATEKSEKLFNVKDLETYAMNGYKAAVSAAWSGAGVKNFKIDIRSYDGEPPTIDVLPKTLDGKDLDVNWRILPKIFKIVQYSISPVGNSDIEREMDYRTEDDIENIFTDEFKNLDAVMDDGKPAKTETAPDDYARDNFLKGALDYAEIEDDKGNVVLLKIAKRYANEIGGDFCLRSYDGETDKSLAMGGIRYVVDRYGEFIDMDPAEAIIKIAKE